MATNLLKIIIPNPAASTRIRVKLDQPGQNINRIRINVVKSTSYITTTVNVVSTVCNKAQYPFGFNGQMKVDEVAGKGNYLHFGLRMYDSRLAHFPTPDPYAKKFPFESPYVFAGDNPIKNIDKNGGYKVDADDEAAYRRDYPLIMKYLSTQLEQDLANSTKVVNGLVQANPNIQPSTVKGIGKWGMGPTIKFQDPVGEFPVELTGAAGYTEKDAHVLQMNSRYARFVEKTLSSKASAEVKQAVFTRFYMTLIHETSHDLAKYGKSSGQDANGNYLYTLLPEAQRPTDEQGAKAEEYIWGTSKYMPFTRPSPTAGNKGAAGITSEKYQPGVVEGVIQEAKKTSEGNSSLPTTPQP